MEYLTPYEVHYGWHRNDGRKGPGSSKEDSKEFAVLVCGLSKPALLLAAAWIDSPKEIQPKAERRANSMMTGIEQKNGFHDCPINELPSVRVNE